MGASPPYLTQIYTRKTIFKFPNKKFKITQYWAQLCVTPSILGPAGLILLLITHLWAPNYTHLHTYCPLLGAFPPRGAPKNATFM